MKNTIQSICFLLIFIVLSSFKSLPTFNRRQGTTVQKQDSVKLLNDHIVASKSKFKGKPLSQFLAGLNLKVTSYERKVNFLKPHEPIYIIVLFFGESGKVANALIDGKEVPLISVQFEHPIERFKPAFKTGYGIGPWGNDEIAYYGPMTVKEIIGLKRIKQHL